MDQPQSDHITYKSTTIYDHHQILRYDTMQALILVCIGTEFEVTILSEQFGKDGVIVTLEWAEENSLYSYNVSVSPQLEVTFIARVRVQVKVPYNSLYSVSVAATPPCQRQNDIMISFVGSSLHYSEYQLYYQYMHNIICTLY